MPLSFVPNSEAIPFSVQADPFARWGQVYGMRAIISGACAAVRAGSAEDQARFDPA
jgi:hypothetical protein